MSFFKAMWKGNSRHKKLCEEWALTKKSSCEGLTTDGVSYQVKYLGSTLVETPSNEKATAEAIKTIISMAKASGKKLQRVSITVNLRGIKVVDLGTEEIHLEVSIYRISYCSADAHHNHVFAFITTNSNETMECHAFLCPKRKVAQAVTLSVAHSFNTVYELWQMSEQDNSQKQSEDFSGFCSKLNHHQTDNKSLLIDLNTDNTDAETTWVSFDNDDSFSSNSTKFSLNPIEKKQSASAWGEDMTLLL